MLLLRYVGLSITYLPVTVMHDWHMPRLMKSATTEEKNAIALKYQDTKLSVRPLEGML